MFINKTIKDITGFEFRYSYGNGKDSYVQYEVLEKADIYFVSIKARGEREEDRAEFEISPDVVVKLEECLNRYKVGKWDGFHKSNKYVLDGNSFSMFVKTKDGTHIEANGYMRYPAKYKEVRRELDGLFEDLYRGFKA